MEQKDFSISTVTSTKAGNKLDSATELEERLNRDLSLTKYGKGIEEVFIVFVVTPPDRQQHDNEINYHPEDKMIELILKLPFQDVLRNEAKAVEEMMRANLLVTAKRMLSNIEIEDFENGTFVADLQQLLGQPEDPPTSS